MALQLIQQHPSITTGSPEFCDLRLSDIECLDLAYQIIDSYSFLGQTQPVTEDQVRSIKKYLRAFVDVDRSALETCFENFDPAEAKLSMAYEIIDARQDLYHLYVEFKRDVVERTRAVTALPSPSPMTPRMQTTRDRSVPTMVRKRDGGLCRVTGVASESYWADRFTEARNNNVGHGSFAACEVARGIPWNVDQPYWELVRRLLGVSGLPSSMDIPQNTVLLQVPIHRHFQVFRLYFDPDFVLRLRDSNGSYAQAVASTLHVRQGIKAIDGQFLNLPILPRQTTTDIPDVAYTYFLLHKLIGDIFYMAGGAETLGLDEFGPDDDPWIATHLVSDFSLPVLDDELERIQDRQEFAIDDIQCALQP